MIPGCGGADVPKGDWVGNAEGEKVEVPTSWCTGQVSWPVLPGNSRKLLHPRGFVINAGNELCFVFWLHC